MRDNAVRVGTVVGVDTGYAEIQVLSGKLFPTEQLGPGIVSETSASGHVKVHWVCANVDAWVLQSDLRQFGENARLVCVRVFNRFGMSKTTHQQIVKGKGLRYNWIVEMRPRNVVRATRPDGQTWTFIWYPLFREAHPIHTMLMDGYELSDDQAEALTVAEVAAGVK